MWYSITTIEPGLRVLQPSDSFESVPPQCELIFNDNNIITILLCNERFESDRVKWANFGPPQVRKII